MESPTKVCKRRDTSSEVQKCHGDGCTITIEDAASTDTLNTSTVPPSTSSTKITPIPMKKVAALFVLLFANAAVSTSPFPFLPFMVQDLGVSVEETGSYVGIVAGGMYLGNTASNWLWGIIADKYGRRPVMLFSTVMQAIFCAVFAVSTRWSIPLATIARFLGGATNGALPVGKTYVSEITDHTNQGKVMSVITISWGAGMVIGPALGGFLSDPARKYDFLDPYPSLKSVLLEYKYALPMLAVGGVCLLSAFLGYVYLIETLPSRQTDKLSADTKTNTPTHAKTMDVNTDDNEFALSSSWSQYLPPLLRHRTRFTAIALYCLLCLQGVGFNELYNVFCATPHALGGLQYTTNDIGFTLIAYGVCQSLVTALIYPALERRYGICALFRCVDFWNVDLRACILT
eukprot:m.35176 g.35176  ORF g.35176 m.35176 type:complete len:402 (-) comp14383_c0_seq2:341-1546(-)